MTQFGNASATFAQAIDETNDEDKILFYTGMSHLANGLEEMLNTLNDIVSKE